MRALARHGHIVRALSRGQPSGLPAGVESAVWDPRDGHASEAALAGVDAVVHLAGENVAQRWTAHAKRRIRESRLEGTRALVAAMSRLPKPPAALISASAVGYYGSRGDETLTEMAGPGQDFLAEVCASWEREAAAAEPMGVRVARLRIGVVLDRQGGALARMLLPFRLGLGGRLGSGWQWMSWIHAVDLAEMFCFAAENPVSGPLNAVAPAPVQNGEFTRMLARALHRPAVFPVPAFALRAMFGEMSGVLLASQRAVPAAAEAAGFQFRFSRLDAALAELLR